MYVYIYFSFFSAVVVCLTFFWFDCYFTPPKRSGRMLYLRLAFYIYSEYVYLYICLFVFSCGRVCVTVAAGGGPGRERSYPTTAQRGTRDVRVLFHPNGRDYLQDSVGAGGCALPVMFRQRGCLLWLCFFSPIFCIFVLFCAFCFMVRSRIEEFPLLFLRLGRLL